MSRWRTVLGLLITLAAAGVEAINVNMTLGRHHHEVFLLNNKLVVMGGAKLYGTPGSDPDTFASDTLNFQTASVVPFNEWNSFDTKIVNGERLTTHVAACARWDATLVVVCTGGFKPGRAPLPNLEISTFSLSAFQTWPGGPGTIDVGLKSENHSSLVHRWDHSAVILGSVYYMFGGSTGKGVVSGPGELWTLDLNTSPPVAKAITPNPATQPWPLNRADFCMVRLDPNSFFIYGGKTVNNGTVHLQDSWIYTVGSGWTPVPRADTYPPPRNGPACTFLNNKVYTFGGENASGSFNDLWSFDPKTMSWTQEFAHSTRLDDGQPRPLHYAKMVGVGTHLILSPGLEPMFSISTDTSLYFFNTASREWVPSKAQLQNISPSDDTSTDQGGSKWPLTPNSKLSGGVIGGIVAAVAVFIVGLLLLLLRWRRSRQESSTLKHRQNDDEMQSAAKQTTADLSHDRPIRPDSTSTRYSTPESPINAFGIGPQTRYTHVPSSSLQDTENSNDMSIHRPASSSGNTIVYHPTSHSDNPVPVAASPLSKDFTFIPPIRFQEQLTVNHFDTVDVPPSYNTLPTPSPTTRSAIAVGSLASPEKSSLDPSKSGIPHIGTVPFRPGGHHELVSGDEIMISVGDIVHVEEVYADGWAHGTNETTHTTGFFPYNCVRMS